MAKKEKKAKPARLADERAPLEGTCLQSRLEYCVGMLLCHKLIEGSVADSLLREIEHRADLEAVLAASDAHNEEKTEK